MITGNRGEWSEIYTLIKLLGEKKLTPGDEKFQKIENSFYPILRILRTETAGSYEYSYEDDLVIVSGGEEIIRVPIHDFQAKATYLLGEIQTNKGVFSVPEIETFMATINCFSLKAGSSAKTDITIEIHDRKTGQQPILGFSIKSQLGNPATLLNAGVTTNFLYKITGLDLSDEEIQNINNISTRSKIKDRVSEIGFRGGKLEFIDIENPVFKNNLVMIDSSSPKILGEMLLNFYSSSISSVKDLLEGIETENPLDYDISHKHQYYSYKVKKVLTDIALGMMPSKVWDGSYDATGGYIVVRTDGEIVCYHIYNKKEFEDYLLEDTKFETGSSSRHQFGEVFRSEDDVYLRLNLQIRFKKD